MCVCVCLSIVGVIFVVLLPVTTGLNPKVPVPHFGVCLAWEQFERLAARLRSQGVKVSNLIMKVVTNTNLDIHQQLQILDEYSSALFVFICLFLSRSFALGFFHSSEFQFIIEPHIRFAGRAGEQMTMFFRDPSGNNLEFKVSIEACVHSLQAMRNPAYLFQKQ